MNLRGGEMPPLKHPKKNLDHDEEDSKTKATDSYLKT